jgi:hypothetical protein
MVIPNLRYKVGPQGWNAPGGHWLDRGTVVDTSVWLEFAGVPPPPDAVPLDQQTYDFMTSNGGVAGLGYPYERVAVGLGIVGINPKPKSLN